MGQEIQGIEKGTVKAARGSHTLASLMLLSDVITENFLGNVTGIS